MLTSEALERAWDDFEAVCARTRGVRFGPVDLAPVRARMEIPGDIAALWGKRYPERPILVDELLFPEPLTILRVLEERHADDWPRSNVLCSDPDAGHHSYQLHRGRMLLLTDEEPFEGSFTETDVVYPDFVAFVIAVTNTLALTPEAFEMRSTKQWLRTKTTAHFNEELCRKLQTTWRYPGFPPLILRASVGTISLGEVIPPPAYAALMCER